MTDTPTPQHNEQIAIAPGVALRRIVTRFWPYARPLRAWIVIGLLFVIAVPAVEAAKIWLFKLVIDDVLVPKDFGPLMWLGIAFLGLTLLGGVLSAADETVSAWVGEKFILRLRLDVFRHLHRISLVSLGRRKIGDLLARLNGDITAIEGFIVGGMTDLVAFSAEVLFFTAALFILSWDLALIALIVVPLFWFIAQRFSDLIRDASRERRRRSGTISALAEESLANAQLVQVYDRHDHQAGRYEREADANLTSAMRSTRLQAIFTPIIDIVEVFGAMIVIGVGTWKLTNNQISIGALLVFLTYLSQLYAPVRGLSKLATSLHSAAAGAERVIEVLDEPVAVSERPDGLTPNRVRGELRFEGVAFAYDAHEQALTDISYTFSPGRVHVITGANGAGKSTLARLALRLDDPSAGRVLLDGTDVRDLDLSWLRSQLAVVLQEGGILDATIRENIAFGKLDAGDEDILAAATTAGLSDLIAELPEGLDTRVGPRGTRLSGGQRQRLAIARALVRDARILVLDEPTNHLDGDGSHELIDEIRTIATGRTMIVISHDPAMIAAADSVLALEHGRVARRVAHSTLTTSLPIAASATI